MELVLGVATYAVASGLLFTLAIAVLRRFSDGPLGPIPGGALRSGRLEREVDDGWAFAERVTLAELQLMTPLASRTTGILIHRGELYVPCDLGFVWRRVHAPARWLMAVVGRIKRWHRDVARDGRVVVRIRGRRFERRAVRVTDPAVLAALRRATEAQAERFLGRPLRPMPADENAIEFFRLDPRD